MIPNEMMTVLLVDDSAAMRRSVREILRSLGAGCVIEAANAAEALRQCSLLAPDVILLDWMLPDGTGADVLAALRTDPDSPAPDADVIVMTASPSGRLLAEANRWGVHSVIRKPFSGRILQERLALLTSAPRLPGVAGPGLLTVRQTA